MNDQDEDTIDVTSATATEDEIRAALGGEPEVEAKPAKKAVVPPTEAETDEGDDVDLEDDGDAPVVVKPVAKVAAPQTEEEKQQLAKERKIADRKRRLATDNATYEDNVRRLGGTVPTFIKRKYANPQAEIDHLSRHRHEVLNELNRVLRDGAKPQPQAATVDKTPAAGDKPAGDKTPEAKKFTFPTWDQYQVDHPDAEYTEFVDARSDARDDFKKTAEAESKKAETDAAQRAEFERTVQSQIAAQAQHVETFAEAYPDFEEKVAAVTFEQNLPTYSIVANLLRQAGADCPKVLYYLADHPQDVTRLKNAKSLLATVQTFGEITYAARLAFPDVEAEHEADDEIEEAPKKAAARPSTNAQPPTSRVRGRSTPTKTLQDLADESDDADEYIARRTRELAGG